MEVCGLKKRLPGRPRRGFVDSAVYANGALHVPGGRAGASRKCLRPKHDDFHTCPEPSPEPFEDLSSHPAPGGGVGGSRRHTARMQREDFVEPDELAECLSDVGGRVGGPRRRTARMQREDFVDPDDLAECLSDAGGKSPSGLMHVAGSSAGEGVSSDEAGREPGGVSPEKGGGVGSRELAGAGAGRGLAVDDLSPHGNECPPPLPFHHKTAPTPYRRVNEVKLLLLL